MNPAGSKTRSSKARTVLAAAAVGSTALTLSPLTAGAVEGTDIISTIAGVGTAEAIGAEGSTSTAFGINSPEDVAVDSNGAVYYSDRNHHQVFKIVDGKTYLVAGVGTAGNSGDGADAKLAQLDEPRGISIDSSDNLYIADSHNDRIRRVDATTGLITTVAGTNGATTTAGCLIPGDQTDTADGDGAAATSARLNCPKDVVVNDAGVMFIADSHNHRIRIVTAGVIETLSGDGTDSIVGGYDFSAGDANGAKLSNPTIVVLDNAGAVLIADNGNNRIRKIVVTGTNGVISTLAGGGASSDAGYTGDNGPAVDALLEGPEGVAVASDGVIYLSDTNNHVIRKIEAGVITTIAGDGASGASGDGSAASAAELYSPEGMTIDADDNLIFAAVGEHKIRMITKYVAPPVTPPTVDSRIINGQFTNSSGNTAAIARLYMAVMKRQADLDPVGHAYWMGRLADGTGYRDIAQFFSTSPEFQSIYGDATNEDFVDLLYWNVMRRVAADDQSGYDYWIARLEAGYPRVDVVTFFSQSTEFKGISQTS